MPAVVARTPFRAALRYLAHDSRLLAGNRLGDPTLRRLPVYVPPQYDTEPERRFPVAFYLSGYGGWGEMKLAEEKAWQEPLWAQFDRLMSSGELEPLIVVAPDCFTRFGGAQYRNSPAFGPYADYVCDELVPLVDTEFRTRPGRDHRAVMGKSSGGYGALFLGMTRPDVFGLVCATAADSLFEISCPNGFGQAVQAYRKAGGPAAFAEQFFAGAPRHPHWMTALMTLASAQAYSPNLDVPVYFADLPFDPDTAELVPEVWQRWLACDPVRLADVHAESLRSLRLLFLDAGTRDEWSLDSGHRALARRLQRHHIAFELEEFDGGHMGIDHRIAESLKRISAVLRAVPRDAALRA